MVVGLLLGACGGSPKHAAPPTPDPIPKTAGPSCKDVAANLATLADRDPTKDASASPIQARCESDHWSDEARSCFATATSEPELDGCKTKLTDAQRQAFAPVAPAAKSSDPWDAKPADSDDDSDDAGDKKTEGSHHTRGPVKKGSKTSDPCEGGE